MEIINKKRKQWNREWQPVWLVALLMMLLSSGVARAAYTTLSGSSYTQSQLAAYEWQHLQFTAENVTLNISSNLNLREIYAPNTNLTIAFSNGAKLNIDQDATISAMNVKGMTVVDNGYIYITGNGAALGVHGGNVEFRNMGADITARTGDAIVGKSGSKISFHNCGVSISAPRYALRGWEKYGDYYDSFNSFSVSGDRSYVLVRGAIKAWDFSISGGYYNQTSNSCKEVLYLVNGNFTGGKIYVTQNLPREYESDEGVCLRCTWLNISNCTLEVNGGAFTAIHGGYINIKNSNVRAIGDPFNGYGITTLRNVDIYYITLEGESNNVLARGYHGLNSYTVNLNGGKLVARGCSVGAGVYAQVLNISMQPGSQFEAYGAGGRDYAFPFQAEVIKSGRTSLNLLRPAAISGTLLGSSNVVGGGKALSRHYSGITQNYFGLPDGTAFSGYVKLSVPHIHNITGVNNPFLLQPSGTTSTKHVTPSDTLLLNLAPLEPYTHFPDADGRPIVRLVKRNPNTGTSSYIVEEQADTTNWSWSYTFTEQDVDCYYTVEVELDGYEGSLRSRQYYVKKLENWNYPIKPTLSFLSGGIRVSNARTNQEYILLSESQFNQFLNTPNEASWWNNSYKPTSSTLAINNCFLGEINYVVTRIKETTTTLAGYEHAHASILLDNSITATTGLKLDVTAMGSGNFADMEYYNGHVTYTTLKSGVLKVTINPIPSNATDFEGIRGQDFNIGHYGAPYNTNMCVLYANSACTTPLNANTRYKTVYVKPLLSQSDLNVVNISLYPDNGGPDDLIATTPLYLNVSDDNGNFTPYTLLINNDEIVETHKWENVEGIPFAVFPRRASLSGDVTVTFGNVQGPFPNFAGQQNRLPTFTVDKEHRTINMTASTEAYMLENHTYYFSVRHKINDDTYGWGWLKVNIVKRDLVELTLDPADATIDPGETAEFTVLSNPVNAWEEDYVNRTFTSSDESVATVRYDAGGTHKVFVTVPEDAPLGATATITVGALETDVTATATITVGGENYNLWVNGNQVNSFNAEDVLGDGTVSYSGTSQSGALTLNGATITSNSDSQAALKSEMPNLIINVVGTNKLSAPSEAVSLVQSANITGDGELKMTSTDGSGLTVALAGYKDITIEESVKVSAGNNSSYGIGALAFGRLSVNSPDAQLRGFGKFASVGYREGLDGTITEPANATHVYNAGLESYFIGDASGNIVNNAWVTINGNPSIVPGDVNGDGVCNAADITALYNWILNNDDSALKNGDQNGDDVINAGDVTTVYNIILGN